MSIVYAIIGFIVFWGALALALIWLGLYLWDEHKALLANLWLWVRVFVLRRPIHMTRSGAYRMVRYAKYHKRKMWLPRQIIAGCIRYSRRVGWKSEDE